jgi:hypothetical protein
MRALNLLVLIASIASAQTARTRIHSSGGLSGTFPAASAATFTLSTEYTWPTASASRFPPCTSAESCVALCRIGAVTGSTTAWECVGPTGSAVGTVTDPGTATIVNGLIPGYKAKDITGATAPSWTSSALDTALNGAYTIVVAGFGRSTAPSGFNYWFSSQDATGSVLLRSESGEFRCLDGSFVSTAVTSLVDGWGFGACRSTGAGTLKATAQLVQASGSITHTALTGGGTYYFGTRAARDLDLTGPLQYVAFYSVSKTDAWLEEQYGRFYGTYTSAGTITTANMSNGEAFDHTADTGNLEVLYTRGQLTTASGLYTSATTKNYWAANAIAAATWTAVATPTTTSNTTSGPLAEWGKAAECDLIVDDNAAAFEGYQSLTAGADAGYYTSSCYLKAGTSGTTTTKARLTVDTDGTGSTNCDITGLTSTATRQTCTALVGGTPTSVKASILVGNATSETGSIQTCQCQLVYSAEPGAPQKDNTLRAAVNYTASTSAWPDPALGGKYEVLHVPPFNPLTQWYDGTESTYYMFDVNDVGAAGHTVAFVFGYTVAGRMLAVVRNGASTSDVTIDGIGLTAGQLYATAVEWLPAGTGKCTIRVRHNTCGARLAADCHAETIIGSDLTGTAICPAAPETMTLGNRYDGASFPSTLSIPAVRIYRKR